MLGLLNTPIVTLIGYVSLFAIAFGNLVDVEPDNDTVGLSGQVLVKVMFLALGGLYGGIGVLTDARVRRLLLSFPMMWMSLLFFFFCLSVLASPTVLLTFAATLSIACVLTLTATALMQLGVKKVLNTLFYASTTYVFLSWLAYWFVPSVGVFMEPTTEGQFIPRMGGLAHPNTLGQTAGMTLVLGLLLVPRQQDIFLVPNVRDRRCLSGFDRFFVTNIFVGIDLCYSCGLPHAYLSTTLHDDCDCMWIRQASSC